MITPKPDHASRTFKTAAAKTTAFLILSVPVCDEMSVDNGVMTSVEATKISQLSGHSIQVGLLMLNLLLAVLAVYCWEGIEGKGGQGGVSGEPDC